MKVIVKKNKEELDELIAQEFITLIKNKPNCVIGLATGSSPLGVYKKMIEAFEKKEISFKKVTSFNLDEYVNYKDYKDSYRYFMDENLFNHVDIDKSNTFFPSDTLLEKYDENIRAAGGVDLQILGIGSDGHIAFNEPKTPFDSKTHVTPLDPQTIKDNARWFDSIDDVPHFAVTAGLDTILHAKKIVLIATGANKKKAVEMMLGKEDINWPASILNRHSDVTIYLDEEANPQK